MLSNEWRIKMRKIGFVLRNGDDPEPPHAESASHDDPGDPVSYNIYVGDGQLQCVVPALDDESMTKELAEAIAASGWVIGELLGHIQELEATSEEYARRQDLCSTCNVACQYSLGDKGCLEREAYEAGKDNPCPEE